MLAVCSFCTLSLLIGVLIGLGGAALAVRYNVPNKVYSVRVYNLHTDNLDSHTGGVGIAGQLAPGNIPGHRVEVIRGTEKTLRQLIIDQHLVGDEYNTQLANSIVKTLAH